MKKVCFFKLREKAFAFVLKSKQKKTNKQTNRQTNKNKTKQLYTKCTKSLALCLDLVKPQNDLKILKSPIFCHLGKT